MAECFNASIETGIFPNFLRIAEVYPLHKSGPTEDPNNFRPISLLCTIGRGFEKAMDTRVMCFLESTNALSGKEFGFGPNKTCSNAVTTLTETMRFIILRKQIGVAAFIDLKKAIDTIDHNLLLTKIERCDVRGQTFMWFKSSFCDRLQYIENNGKTAEVLPVNCGVPQGSVLGPFLF